MSVLARRRLTVLIVAGGFSISCGPGFEAMHESDLRFEHCYRLDMDSKIAPPHREHCWRDWTQTYAQNEPLDRIDYARRRISELEAGDAQLVSIHHQEAAESRVFEEVGATDVEAPIAAPLPTSAHEPPPRTAPSPFASTASVAPLPSALPGSGCATQCDQTFSECTHLCEAKQADCATCREDYRSCMRRCFE